LFVRSNRSVVRSVGRGAGFSLGSDRYVARFDWCAIENICWIQLCSLKLFIKLLLSDYTKGMIAVKQIPEEWPRDRIDWQ
jgi:hypothetical protein